MACGESSGCTPIASALLRPKCSVHHESLSLFCETHAKAICSYVTTLLEIIIKVALTFSLHLQRMHLRGAPHPTVHSCDLEPRR